jgi:LacI family transcriptional regulator
VVTWLSYGVIGTSVLPIPNQMSLRVLLLLDTTAIAGRQIMRGIGRYMRVHGPWACYFEPGPAMRLPEGLVSWRGDGIIADVRSRELRDAIGELGLHCVNVTNRADGGDLPCVFSDDAAIGRLAAEHLIGCGYRRFGYLGFSDLGWSRARRESFNRVVVEAGYECAHFKPREGAVDWERHRQAVADWLATLRPPVGIMACYDLQARMLIEVCRRVGLRVPDDVGVVGVDNDESICDLSSPPLSSVDPAHDMRGYAAAEMLASLMRGEAAPALPSLVPPRGVVVRLSSDTVAVEDEEVAQALRFIRDNIGRPIGVPDLLRAIPVSRRALEQRFAQAIGRSPAEEIRRVRIDRATRLLAGTDLTLDQVARKCGLPYAKALQRLLSRAKKKTAVACRRQHPG